LRPGPALRDIRNILAETKEWGVSNFGHTPYTNDQDGQLYPAFEMTKDGFAVLAIDASASLIWPT